MDERSVAETLPELYRRVLDRIADLEGAGHRSEADLVRRDAIAAYSRRWNARAARALDRLADRAERVLAGRDWPRDPGLSRRRGAARWLAMGPARLRRRIGNRPPGNQVGGRQTGEMSPEPPPA